MTKLVGELVAVDWDRDEEPSELCIETEDDRYLIMHSEHYEELLHYVGQEVQVEGTIEEDSDGEQVIDVHTFQVLSPFAEVAGLDDAEEYEDEEELLEENW